MCGIAGIWDPHGSLDHSIDELCGITARMGQTMAHRGPDDDGIWRHSEQRLVLGHRRLSIVDLSETGRQPMRSSCGRFCVSYNGEIYNWRELRQDLEAAGTRFRGTSDTEVLVEAVVAWGVTETLARASGMFALALWDMREGVLHLARDRMGEKPLYYTRVRDAVVFASELSSLRLLPEFEPTLDVAAIADVLSYGYVRSPRSIYRGVWKLGPAQLMTLRSRDLEAAASESSHPSWAHRSGPYWSLPDPVSADEQPEDDSDVTRRFDRLLRQAVENQLVADVPVGAFLSGGLDSSTVVAIAQSIGHNPVKTFTVRFPVASHDESVWAQRVADELGTRHTVLDVDHRTVLDTARRIADVYDEPFADPSQIPTYLISRFAREHVKVCLTGDGGDEVFGGYNRYSQFEKAEDVIESVPSYLRVWAATALKAVPVKGIDAVIGQWRRLTGRADAPLQNPGARLHKLADMFAARSSWARYDSLLRTSVPEDLLRSNARGTPDAPGAGGEAAWSVDEMMRLDLAGYLVDDNLVKVDRASMAVSLECRAPLLDHRVVENALRLAPAHRIRNGSGKWVLRRILANYVDSSLIERPKAGFSIPISHWFRHELADWLRERLSRQSLARMDFLNPSVVERVLGEHMKGQIDHGRLLWSLAMLQSWLEHAETGMSPGVPSGVAIENERLVGRASA